MSELQNKLKTLPKEPGVYFHKDAKGTIIYVGKAAVLNNRVRQYFQKSRSRDPKTEALVADIADTDWMVVESELEALFLEAEMIRRYMPRYNILLRDDKSMTYIRIDYNSEYPTVTTTRRPLDDGAQYFGPYLSSQSVRKALKYLRRVFPYAVARTPNQKRATLYYHLGLDPGLEEGRTSLEEYRSNLRKLIAVIQGKRTNIVKELERDMRRLAKRSQFEEAAKVRNQVFALKRLDQQVIFSDKEFMDISKDHALNELTELLGLYEPETPEPSHADGMQGDAEKRTEPYLSTVKGVSQAATQQPAATSGSADGSAVRNDSRLRRLRRIEGYDISHMQGTDVVASMVVFTNGVSDKGQYRKFKTKIDHNNDFYNMNETIKRRLSDKNIKSWGKPDLMLIDGGKGQLDAALKARDDTLQAQGLQSTTIKSTSDVFQGQALESKSGTARGQASSSVPMIGLAKREEQIVVSKLRSNVSIDMAVVQKLGGFVTETDEFVLINLPHSTNLIKLLQRIRDESHRFAVTYHSVLKTKRQTASLLDDIPTIGPETRKKLLKTFGSVRGVMQARDFELEKVVGTKKATILQQYIRAHKKAM